MIPIWLIIGLAIAAIVWLCLGKSKTPPKSNNKPKKRKDPSGSQIKLVFEQLPKKE